METKKCIFLPFLMEFSGKIIELVGTNKTAKYFCDNLLFSSKKSGFTKRPYFWRHSIWHNDFSQNTVWHHNIRHNNIEQTHCVMVDLQFCCQVSYCFAAWHCDQCHSAECRYCECALLKKIAIVYNFFCASVSV